mmetsp:Transcript_10548/g.23373  ORF Transcript_10548/g.23373 Transcript_10548/m.23373 type:complete len:345 (+) Transcript_10548:97-1131(+)|eukprot:CAMPEP_0172310408 /NCGR_PEP_ID=MMETSP1058-20130122/11470_1 /TAXON_ID=83371 /ORGANISM="Detonula confervacea, Strain CCMP 353" /LENGTH=344 /DNA_ID=CAMNT_0013023211 /DNA_START=31 /DNA_END=1065 /DNA_ORIENTATION=-
MVNTSRAALIILSVASPTSAFVQVGPAPQRTFPLHATEAFQRSLLAERFGTTSTNGDISPDAEAKTQENEKFQRSLLEAKIAYDAIDAALAATPAVVDVATPAPTLVEVAAVASEPEQVSEPEPVVVVLAAAATPEPEIPKPVIPEPVAANQAVEATGFTVPREFAIVPINEATVQFTAGALGAIAGLALGGPILAALSASIFNYLSRKEEDKSDTTSPKQIVDKAAYMALMAYNSLAQFEKDNKIVDTTLKLAEKVADKAKESDSPAGDVLVSLESTLGGIANKVSALNDDYDLVGGAETVLDSVGDLVEIGVDKVVKLNDEYKLTDRVGGVMKGTVEKVTEK